MMKNFLKSISILSAVILCLPVLADTYLVDFNTTGNSGSNSGFPIGSGSWNVYAAPGDITGAVIQNTSGLNAAGITLSASGKITDSGNGNTAVFNNSTGGASWVTTDGSLGNTSAASDYFFTSTTVKESYIITFGGLVQGQEVSLDLWFSRNGSLSTGGRGNYDYSLDEGSTWSAFTVLEKDGTVATDDGWDANNTLTKAFYAHTDGNVEARYMNVNGLTIGADESVLVRTTDESASRWSGIGAIQLSVIPEPSTLLLQGMGMLILVFGLKFRRPPSV